MAVAEEGPQFLRRAEQGTDESGGLCSSPRLLRRKSPQLLFATSLNLPLFLRDSRYASLDVVPALYRLRAARCFSLRLFCIGRLLL